MRSKSKREKQEVVANTVCIVILIVLCLITFFALKTSGSTDVEDAVYIVGDNETLWEIATEISDNRYDVREVIYDISKANGIEDCIIHAGDELVIPGKYVMKND